MSVIDGITIADRITKPLKQKVASLSGTPGLAVVLVGDDPASHVYVGLKEEAAQEVGIHFEKYLLPATTDQQEVIELLQSLSRKKEIHGIIIQFPLPKGFDKTSVINAITPEKDVDGFRPDNIEALLAGRPIIIPGLSAGIVQLIDSTGEELNEKRAIVIARSKVFSEPLGYLLGHKGITVKAYLPDDKVLKRKAPTADILIVAVGEPKLITGDMVKEGAIVIDVGYNRVDGKPVGDVDFKSVSAKASWVTPVPGGVGPVTVAMLLYNVARAYEQQS